MIRPTIERTAREYQTTDGQIPFQYWLFSLRDARAKARITKAIAQMDAGNFGDHKPIAQGHGLQERRIDYGPGYRIYYITEGDTLIVLFGGSDKSDQQEAIDRAKTYLADYQRRKPVAALRNREDKDVLDDTPPHKKPR